jgi:Uma2 family endonuclease
MEVGYKLGDDPATWIEPDVSFLRNERVTGTTDGSYCLGAPELAVEVVSPSESARDLRRKVAPLLKAGSLAVWVIYPEERTVEVYRPDGTSYTADTLSAPELVAGWEAPVASLFED